MDLHVVVYGKISVSVGDSIANEFEAKVFRDAPCVAEALVHLEPDDKESLLYCLLQPQRASSHASFCEPS